MPINQIDDDGAVIGYKPELQYKKDRRSDLKSGHFFYYICCT